MIDLENFEFTASCKTSVGNVRTINEDAFFENSQQGIWAVADGMGGHQSGDLASRLITQSLATVKQEKILEDTVEKVKECLNSTNLFLVDEAALREGNQTIGSTVVVFICQGRECSVLWVGDSRLYRMRDNTLELLTSDHSQVQELVDIGVLLPENAESHPSANIITRAIGASKDLNIDSKQFDLQKGDIFLLCSDGLYKELNETEIEEILVQNATKDVCDELIEAALINQCRDNVTVVTVETLVVEKTVLRGSA